jgi:hypothetical protein
MGASQNKSGVSIQFLVGGLIFHSAGIFHLFCSVQKLFKNFMLVQWLNLFSILGVNMASKIFFANLETFKRHFFLENMRRLRHYGPGGYSRWSCRGPDE